MSEIDSCKCEYGKMCDRCEPCKPLEIVSDEICSDSDAIEVLKRLPLEKEDLKIMVKEFYPGYYDKIFSD